MSRSMLKLSLLAATVGLLFPGAGRADENDDEKLFQKVMHRLLSTDVADTEYPKKYFWPPQYFIKPKSQNEFNAYASAHKLAGAAVQEKTGKVRPVVMITQGFMKKVIRSDENLLAVIMGHELAHLTRDHVAGRKGDTEFLLLAFSRDHEIEADLNGIRYAVAAGYPYKDSVASMAKEMRALPGYSSFEGLHASHPSWDERLALLDRQQAKLWSAMASFRNGNFFLEIEQYLAAQHCFKAVLKEFPDCYEAWANLGYVQLMRYFDGLDTDDLRRYGIGQVMAGGFYTRPVSLESKVRGIDEKLWIDAVKALNRAITLRSDLVLPRASLGLAFLVHPEGKNVKKAKQYFAEAMGALAKDPELRLNSLARSSLIFNAAVVDLAGGDIAEASKKFTAAMKLNDLEFRPLARNMEGAFLYNRALLDSFSTDNDSKRKAHELLEDYLIQTSADSAWWPLAYERYVAVAKELKLEGRPKNKFSQETMSRSMRMVTSVPVGPESITLAESVQQVVEHLGKDAGVEIPLVPGSKMVRWRFAAHGIDLLARDKVLAIFLTSAKAPPLKVQALGAATRIKEIRVGMPEKDLKELLKEQPAERGQRHIADTRTAYHFYPTMGLAVRFDKGQVAELALVQMPRRFMFEDGPAEKEKER